MVAVAAAGGKAGNKEAAGIVGTLIAEMAKAKGVTEKIQNAHKALEEQGAGAFEEVARKFSESDESGTRLR